jgi:hypothetical protein
MRDRRWVGTVYALLGVLLAACRSPTADGTEGGRTTAGASGVAGAATVSVSPAVPVSGFGTVFLDVDECSSFGTTSFTEVPCGGERAAARVVARHDGKAGVGPPCPATTDFVLHIDEQPAEGAGRIPQGYACMRNLQPPHPGDPGAGGGPRTIVGDCVYGAGDGQVRETACDGSGTKRPQYEVTKAVRTRSACPSSTTLYVHLGGVDPVGCARPV